MRIETTLNLTGSSTRLAEAVGAELPSVSTLLAERARRDSPELATASADEDRSPAHADHWQVDEHWTAVTAYLADLYLPNEG